MTRARSLARLAVVCGVLGLPAACAVLEINVDVYKGPLANHQDVQVEQMAAMAIGAKPLLIELRDRLEWGDNVEARRQERAIKRNCSTRSEQRLAVDCGLDGLEG